MSGENVVIEGATKWIHSHDTGASFPEVINALAQFGMMMAVIAGVLVAYFQL